MFFWMIVFYCFFIYCARLHGHLEYTGDELNLKCNVSSKDGHKEDENPVDQFFDDLNNGYEFKDIPGNSWYNPKND